MIKIKNNFAHLFTLDSPGLNMNSLLINILNRNDWIGKKKSTAYVTSARIQNRTPVGSVNFLELLILEFQP
jgi:hypothetical protein